MPGFIGQGSYSLDDKARLMIPARFKKKFHPETQSLYILKAQGGILELYEPEVWRETEEALDKLNDFNPEDRFLKTFIYGNLDEVDLDKSNRITIAKDFLEHAAIQKELVVVGARKKLQLWSPDRFGELQERYGEFETIARRVF
jgi:MraZ protein